LEARELAILSMLERIKAQIMTRIHNKQKEEMKWTGLICPKIKKKVDRNVDFANNCFVDGAGDGLSSVAEIHGATPTTYIVDLKTNT
jgi:nucleoside-triphosphatase THEP1